MYPGNDMENFGTSGRVRHIPRPVPTPVLLCGHGICKREAGAEWRGGNIIMKCPDVHVCENRPNLKDVYRHKSLYPY